MKRINHMMDINENFFQINKQINDLREQIVVESKVDYKSQDARHVALDSIQREMLACRMWITSLNSLANKFTFTDNMIRSFDEKGFLKAVGSPLNIKDTEIVMLDTLRLGFVVLVHFKIDNLLRNILREIKPNQRVQGYRNLCRALLCSISVTQKDDKRDILILLAYLRNSMHNNGIHNGSSLTKTLNGLNYSFVDGKVVKCASWDHIIELLSANIEVLSKILLSNEIKSLDHEIEDKYSASINPI